MRAAPRTGHCPVDLRGFEPLTSSVRLRRAPNCATGPLIRRRIFYLRHWGMSSKLLFPLGLSHLKRSYHSIHCKIGLHLFPKEISWLTSLLHRYIASWICANPNVRVSD